jgi:hypothetical protein
MTTASKTFTVTVTAPLSGTFTDDFSSGNLSKVQNGISWASSTNAAVYTGFGRSGNNCLRMTFIGGASGTDSFAEQRFDLGSTNNYTNVTLEWWAFYPNGTEGLGPKFVHRGDSPGNNKFFRLIKGNRSDGNDGFSSSGHGHGASTNQSSNVAGDERAYVEWSDGDGMDSNGSHYNVPAARGVENFITDAHRGRWIPIKIVNRAATVANNDGVIQIWRDGVLVMNATTLDSYPLHHANSGEAWKGFDFGYIMGWANSGHLQTTYLYIDDVSITVS